MAEGVMLVDAALMSIRPKGGAVVLAVIAPVGAAQYDTALGKTLSFVTLEGVAAYHALGMDIHDRYGTRFGRSLLAWNTAALLLFGIHRLDGSNDTQVSVLPIDHGAAIRYARRY
jgi:hypothetical protein